MAGLLAVVARRAPEAAKPERVGVLALVAAFEGRERGLRGVARDAPFGESVHDRALAVTACALGDDSAGVPRIREIAEGREIVEDALDLGFVDTPPPQAVGKLSAAQVALRKPTHRERLGRGLGALVGSVVFPARRSSPQGA